MVFEEVFIIVVIIMNLLFSRTLLEFNFKPFLEILNLFLTSQEHQNTSSW